MGAANIRQQQSDTTTDYRYKRFTTSLLLRDLRFGKEAAGPGDSFPSFELLTTNGDRLVNDDVFGHKPVLLIFGSMTCPMTASAAPSVQELHDEFGDRVDFIMLYVREAHPGEHFTQSETMEEKLEYARALQEFYDIQWTVAADNIDGDLHRALDPKPNAAFLMNDEGIILFRSLWAADRDAMRQALAAAAAGRAPERKQSETLLGPVIRAMGQVQEVMNRGGPQAVGDLWRAGFPMALAGRVATFFTPLSPDQRGIAAVLTLALGMLAALGMLGAWSFA
ncbi:MAG: deiodinase-like protein [Nitrospiraceae bacterium]